MSAALRDIEAERLRQKTDEGWTDKHDDGHERGELALAAAAYAFTAADYSSAIPRWRPYWWPWDVAWWKPKTRREDLIRAGALIVAEIERLDRLSAKGRRR